MWTKPFETAERYIQLRRRCFPRSWGDIVIFFNELILGPFITVFLLCMGNRDIVMVISAIMRAYSAWQDWEEFHSLQSQLQQMYLEMNLHGGPHIRTNDPEYFPYVIADAMVRLDEHRPLP
jgi:hypothetical protein